jgi:DNA mismatch repair protein MutL
MKAYNNVLPSARYPVSVLHITVQPTDVDINIHPRKEEVRFLHPRILEDLLKSSVKQGLETQVSRVVNDAVLRENISMTPHTLPALPPVFSGNNPKPHVAYNPVFYAPKKAPTNPSLSMQSLDNVSKQQSIDSDYDKFSYTLIGQLHATYILIENSKGLCLIDQHAAHERILYEKIVDRLNMSDTITLLFPVIVTLKTHEYRAILDYLDLLACHGIVSEPFGNNQLKISASSPHCNHISWQDFFTHCATDIINETSAFHESDVTTRITHAIRAQMACKAAVKAGDVLTRVEMEKLIADLYKTNNCFSCPHGRPTIFVYSLYELEKKFRRVGG